MNALSILLVSLTLAGGQTGVTGIVLDQSGGAVAGATVIVRGDTGTEEQTVTGPDGRFRLLKNPGGTGTF